MKIKHFLYTIGIILLVFTLSSKFTKSSEVKNTSTQVGIDYRLVSYVNDYVEEGNKRGIYISNKVSSMDFIGFSRSIQYPKLGFTSGDNKKVFIANFCQLDENVLRMVIYHELTHAVFNRDHTNLSKYDIMSESLDNFSVYKDSLFLKNRLDELFFYKDSIRELNFKKKESRIVTATVYNAVAEQCNSDPGHTASMFKLDLKNPYKHKILAVSRDLLKDYPMGTSVKLTGTKYDGIYQIQDKMNKRYKNRIDILINTDMKIGKWNNAKIEKI